MALKKYGVTPPSSWVASGQRREEYMLSPESGILQYYLDDAEVYILIPTFVLAG